MTVREVAARYRVSKDKVLGWIRRGELSAINTMNVRCGKPRFVILPEAMAAFERGRQAEATNAPKARRRRRMAVIDFYPD
jgi:excisionase family DNA binding protein